MKQMLVELREGAPIAEQMAEVVEEYRSGRYKNLLLHVYTGVPREEELVRVCRELTDCCGTKLIAGTMSAGEIKDGQLMPQGLLVGAMLFEDTDVTILRYDDMKGREVQVGRQIRQTLDGIEALKGVELLFPGTEMDTQLMYAEISKCREGIQIFGGYTGGQQPNSPEHFIFDASGAMYNSMLLVTFAGKRLRIDADRSIGWEPLGMPFKVTRARGKRLLELDYKPAAQVYEKFLQIDRKKHNNADDALEFPLIAKLNGDERLRSTIHIEEDGSLTLYGFVTEGMDIYLSYGNPTNIVEEVNRRLERLSHFRPQAILLYSCIARKVFWEDFVDMEMKPFAQIASTAGFHTWGEVLRDERTGEVVEHNVTLLSIGMREGDAPAEALGPVRIDDTVLQGQASMLKRLTRLVYTTMEELQKAHNHLSVLNQKLTVMAEHDALTGLYNRGKIEHLINDALDRAADTGHKVSLIMGDLDRFKQINDTYGHDTGDAALRIVAGILQTVISDRNGARAGRWGGEEFFLLLPDTGEGEVMAIAQRLKAMVETRSFPQVGHLTISQGVITVSGLVDRKDVYTQVDNALYAAKEAGRNSIVRADWMES